MILNSLHNSELKITPITLGTWAFGGVFWGGGKESDCIDAVRAAIAGGINCIDTAPIYSQGRSEEIVGKAIKGKRDQLVIATKCGLSVKGNKIVNDLSAKAILREVDESRRRLGIDSIDLYQCHWPDKNTPMEDTLKTLIDLKTKGIIKNIGLSNHTGEQFRHALSLTDIVTSQDQYSLLVRDVEQELLPLLKEKQIGLLAYGSLAGGILTGKYQKQPTFKNADARKFFYKFYDGKAFEQTQRFLEQMRQLGRPLGQVAINWVRAQSGVASVLVGCRNPQQVEENIAALSWEFTEDELKALNDSVHELVYE